MISTLVWYLTVQKIDLKLEVLCFFYWGASIMWFVDTIYEYIEMGQAYFVPGFEDMVNDTFLGLSVVALALVIWIVRLLLSDPQCVIANKLTIEKKKA